MSEGHALLCILRAKFDCRADQDVFFKWWKAEESSKPLDQKDRILNPGKPNVSLRKIINPQNPDGTRNTDSVVNAQNYVVLVTDVPDIVKGKKRYVAKTRRRARLHVCCISHTQVSGFYRSRLQTFQLSLVNGTCKVCSVPLRMTNSLLT